MVLEPITILLILIDGCVDSDSAICFTGTGTAQCKGAVDVSRGGRDVMIGVYYSCIYYWINICVRVELRSGFRLMKEEI